MARQLGLCESWLGAVGCVTVQLGKAVEMRCGAACSVGAWLGRSRFGRSGGVSWASVRHGRDWFGMARLGDAG
jgi:hypothetical protein